MKAEGAIVIAKSNLAEMAFGSYDSEMGGACRNPWDLTRSCSRSSSGSGCGIAAGLAVISIGTDTDGSIMGPASYNGLFWLRPPYGGLVLMELLFYLNLMIQLDRLLNT